VADRRVKSLRELAAAVPGSSWTAEAWVSGLALDSRRVQPGDLFLALPGTTTDGARFVPQAVAAGAAAVLTERPDLSASVPLLRVPDARAAAASIAAAFYDWPARQLRVSGVTGTDGKTTTTHLLWWIFSRAGQPTGLVNTVRIVTGRARPNETNLTTPDAITIQALLAEMVAAGCQRAVLEASSHALDQQRLDGVAFATALCTNLAPEHLNYHGTLERYIAAKSRLFSLLVPGGVAVRNADNPLSDQLTIPPDRRVLTFGLERGEVRAEAVTLTATGSHFRLVTPVGRIVLTTPLVGRFNVENWLAAAAVGVAEGLPLEVIARAAATVPPVPGRLEEIRAGQPFRVVVDFAHTPQALAAALQALRPLTTGRLIVVFGHAGERDAANRPRMGEVAAALADEVIITMDDPYSEDPGAIAEAIEAGIAEQGRRLPVTRELDRRAAIRLALLRARPGDSILIAGRGHETTIPLGEQQIAFADAAVARELLGELGYRAPENTQPAE
jgi:UDP-N-acetylmuramoyl-L-alanyl-D-glutamate--2,6-diaminopimelate ligase